MTRKCRIARGTEAPYVLPVPKDYNSLAMHKFRLQARGACVALRALELEEDFAQEATLAGLTAQKARMNGHEALRLFGRMAHAFLRSVGFVYRPQRGYIRIMESLAY